MRIRTLFAIALLAGTGRMVAQTVSPTVIASAGGSGTAGGVTIMWTVGELAVTTLEGTQGQGYVTQGFHQPPPGTVSAPYEEVPTASFEVWPNPAANALIVSFGEAAKGIDRLEIVDMMGRSVLKTDDQAGVSELRLDLSAVPSGTYLVRLKSGAEQLSRVVTIRK